MISAEISAMLSFNSLRQSRTRFHVASRETGAAYFWSSTNALGNPKPLGISKLDQLLPTPGVTTVHSYSDADCELLVAIGAFNLEIGVLYGFAQALCHRYRLLFRGFGQNDNEFFAPIPRDSIDFAHIFYQQ